MSAFGPRIRRPVDGKPAMIAVGVGIFAAGLLSLVVFGDRLIAAGTAPLAGFAVQLGTWVAGLPVGRMLRDRRCRRLGLGLDVDERPMWVVMSLGAIVGSVAALVVQGSRVTPLIAGAAGVVIGAGAVTAGLLGRQLLQERRRG